MEKVTSKEFMQKIFSYFAYKNKRLSEIQKAKESTCIYLLMVILVKSRTEEAKNLLIDCNIKKSTRSTWTNVSNLRGGIQPTLQRNERLMRSFV